MFREELSIQCYRGRFLNPFTVPTPGEHHFCSIYLLNKFYRLPDYINPDGTKGITGDIVFYQRKGPTISAQKTTIQNKKLALAAYGLTQNPKFTIEVKYGNIKFTKDQYNTWFKNDMEKPDFLIALTENYLFIIEWKSFADIYSSCLYPSGHEIIKGYSKTISEDDLIKSDKLKENIDYFNLNSPSEIKLENNIDNRFKKLNGLIEKTVKYTPANNIGPNSSSIRTTQRLHKVPKSMFTEEIIAKYKSIIEDNKINLTKDDVYCDFTGQLYYKISNCDFLKYKLKIPELLKD